MTLDGFLTFLTLAVAILALVSPTAMLRLRLGFNSQCILAVIAIGLVLYFQFFESVGRPCAFPEYGICGWITFPRGGAFTPQQASFIVVILWIVLAYIIYKLSKLGPGSLVAFSRLVGSLIYDRKFRELIKLVEPHLSQIERASNRQLWTQRLHDCFAQLRPGTRQHFADIFQGGFVQQPEKGFWGKALSKLKIALSMLSAVIPARDKTEEESKEILRMLFRSEDLVRYVAKTEPHFAINLLGVNYYARNDFAESYFTELISDTGSALYEEMRNNLNCSSQEGYWFPEHNRILHFLFADAETANSLSVYRPVGEFVLRNLRADESRQYIQYLNQKPEGFEDERFKDRTYAGIFFFDLMVTAAAHQGIEWHMWLHYFYYFVERLDKIYDTSNEGVDETDEFPIRTAWLIYQCFDVLGEWVKLIRYLPADSRHRTIEPGLADNGNIPASAALVLARCMNIVASSPRIGQKFSRYLHTVVLRDIDGLGRDGDEGDLRAYLINQVVNGGRLTVGPEFGNRLASYLEHEDLVLRGDVDDYEVALRDKYPGILT